MKPDAALQAALFLQTSSSGQRLRLPLGFLAIATRHVICLLDCHLELLHQLGGPLAAKGPGEPRLNVLIGAKALSNRLAEEALCPFWLSRMPATVHK